MFTAIKSERLFQTLGLREREVDRVSLWPGQFTHVEWTQHETDLPILEWRVYPEISEARSQVNETKFTISSGWRQNGAGVTLGDEHYIFGSGESGSILFRRCNVVVYMGWKGSKTEALSLAEVVDALIRDDRAIAPLGTFDPPPEIVDAGIPATLAVRATQRRLLDDRPWPFGEPARSVVRINPQFRGLGPVENIRLRVEIEGLGSNQVGQVIDWTAAAVSPPSTAWSASRLAAAYEYDPYGNVTASAGAFAAANPFRFSTKYWDDETGLGYWGYRYYSPRLGRWVSRDPEEEAGGVNLYCFILNEPISKTDKLGLAVVNPDIDGK